MRKTINLTAALCLTILGAVAQGGFKKQYTLPNTNGHNFSISQNAIEAPNGNFITIGLSNDTLNGAEFKYMTLLGLDNHGTILWTKNYNTLSYTYLDYAIIRSSVAKDQNAFYYVATVKNTSNKIYSVLIKCDYNGDTLWCKPFFSSQNGYLGATGIIKTVDGGLLITGASEAGIISIKTNLNGNELWRKVLISGNYSTLQTSKITYKTVQDSLTKKILYVSGNQVFTSDSLGNYLAQTTFTTYSGVSFFDMIQTKDKKFIVAGTVKYTHQSESLPPIDVLTTYLVKFDMVGSVLWKRLGPDCGSGKMAAICENPDGSLITAREQSCFLNTNGNNHNTILKLNQDGYILKQIDVSETPRIGNYPDMFYWHLSGINILSDGGIIVTQRKEYSSLQTIAPYFVIKLDSIFCDSSTAYCLSVVGIQKQSSESDFNFIISPNPAAELAHIKLQIPADKTMALKITDALGRDVTIISNVTTDTELNTAGYTNGIYFIQALYEGRVVETKRLLIIH